MEIKIFAIEDSELSEALPLKPRAIRGSPFKARSYQALCSKPGAIRGCPFKARSYQRFSLQSQELSKVLPLKPGVGQNIADHAMPTARNYLPSNFYIPSPFNFIFSRFSLCFFLPLDVANAGSCVGLWSKKARPSCLLPQVMEAGTSVKCWQNIP